MTQTSQAAEPQPPHLSIVVPAWNEAVRIRATLARMLEYFDSQGYSFEILVVSDGSTDGTPEAVREVAEGRHEVRDLHYEPNRGKGHAVRYGILRAAGDFVLFSDADLATPIEEVEPLFNALKAGHDIAIGSRDVPGSRLERHQSLPRELAGKTFNRAVRLIAVPGIHDTQCGFKLFTRESAADIFGRCLIDNFSFDVEALYLARKLGYSIAEVPIRWAHQEGSTVKPLRDGYRMVKTLFRIRATRYDIDRRKSRAQAIPAPCPPPPSGASGRNE